MNGGLKANYSSDHGLFTVFACLLFLNNFVLHRLLITGY